MAWLGKVLFHPKELFELEQRKENIRAQYPGKKLEFDMKESPGSGEIFTTFYDLHVTEIEEQPADADNS